MPDPSKEIKMKRVGPIVLVRATPREMATSFLHTQTWEHKWRRIHNWGDDTIVLAFWAREAAASWMHEAQQIATEINEDVQRMQ